MFAEDETLIEVDTKSEEQIKKIKPDFILCDQGLLFKKIKNQSLLSD